MRQILLAYTFGTAALLIGCNSPIRPLYPPAQDAPTKTIWVTNNHWHSMIVVKRADLDESAAETLRYFESYPYLEIGWGDQAYFRSAEPTSGTTLAAACWPTPSVLHVAGLSTDPETHYTGLDVEIYSVMLSGPGYKAMMQRIVDEFRRDEQGRPIDLQRGWYADSRFYQATSRYTIAYNCNHWTAETLRAAGLGITP